MKETDDGIEVGMAFEDFPYIATHLLRTAGEPTKEGIEKLHLYWKSAYELEKTFEHPIHLEKRL